MSKDNDMSADNRQIKYDYGEWTRCRNGTFHIKRVDDTSAESGLKRRQHGKVHSLISLETVGN